MLSGDPQRRRFGTRRRSARRDRSAADPSLSRVGSPPARGRNAPRGCARGGRGPGCPSAPLFSEVAPGEHSVPTPPPPNQPHGAAPRGPTGATRGIFNPGFGVGCRGRRESGGAVRGLAGSCVTFKGPRDALRGSDRPSGSAPVRLSAGRGFLFRVSPRSDPRPNAAGSALRAAAPIALSARTAPIPARLRCGATGGGTGWGVGAAAPSQLPFRFGSPRSLGHVGVRESARRIPPSFPFGRFANPAFWGMSFAAIGCAVTFCGDSGGAERL